jgi:hypothetical protein
MLVAWISAIRCLKVVPFLGIKYRIVGKEMLCNPPRRIGIDLKP